MDLIQRIIHAITQVHPPHIMFVHFPIGLAGGAAFFILLAMIYKKDVFEKIAFGNLALAAFASIVAAGLGIRDNLHNFNGAAPNHTLKIILAVIFFIIAASTALIRWRNPNLFHTHTGKILYVLAIFVCFILMIALGFLGGVIVYGGL